MTMDAELLEVFRSSCMEQLAGVEARILDLENQTSKTSGDIDAIFRSFHSLKADAAAMGLTRMATLSRQAESLLQLLRSGQLPVTRPLVEALLSTVDRLNVMALAPAQAESRDITEDLVRLSGVLAQALETLPSTAGTAPTHPGQKSPETSQEDLPGDMPDAKAGASLDIAHISLLTVPAARLDALVDQVGEMAVSQASLALIAQELQHRKLSAVAEEVERLTVALRNQVMSLRMLPLKMIFAKFRRLVRDVAEATGRRVVLVEEGENVELDKTAIEQLQGPLVHILRNAVDHGIEPPEERIALGKPPEGRVLLSARQLGGEVEIMVQDDGCGMDTDRLRREAVAHGLLAAEDRPSEQALLELAFMPGLSTRSDISDYSGRGVGMDAVRTDISHMRGTVKLSSSLGAGTTVTLRVPLSLAILDCLQVQAGQGMFFLHLSGVEECFELRRSQVGLHAGLGAVGLRGDILPVLCLQTFFGAETGAQLPDLAPVVVVHAGDQRFGLIVDRIVGHRQAVLKKISQVMGEMPAIQGGAVMEDGGMALVLDLPALARAALVHDQQRQESACRASNHAKARQMAPDNAETT